MKAYVETIIKKLEQDYLGSLDRLYSDYNREKELKENYRGRELLELLQNADDELRDDLPKEVKISFIGNELTISNYGNPFSEAGISSLFYPNNSGKSERKKKVIGNKGTGFRSILGWADQIEIHSGDFNVLYSYEYSQKHLQSLFKDKKIDFSKYKAPTLAFPQIIERKKQEYTTTISIKTGNNAKVSKDILKQIKSINDELILFLNNTEVLIIETEKGTTKYIRKNNGKKVTVEKYVKDVIDETESWIFNRIEGTIKKEWYSIIVAYKESGETPKKQVLYTYFPTKVDFPFPVLLHANFVLDGNRNHLIDSDFNDIILDKAAGLLVETIRQRFSDRVSYAPLEFLLNHDQFSTDLNTYEFEDKLNKAIGKSKIFPTVNNTYVSLKKEPVFFESYLAKYLSGKEFADLLKCYETNDDRTDFYRNNFIKKLKKIPDNGFWRYEDNYLTESINNWVKSQIQVKDSKKSITKNAAQKIAFTALEFIKEFYYSASFDNNKPRFILNQDCEQIDTSNPVFITSGDLEITDPPKFSNIHFMNSVLAKAFKDIDEDYIDKLSEYKVNAADYHNIVSGMNERIDELIFDDKIKEARKFCITEIRWIWKNRNALKNEEGYYPIFFFSRNNDIVKTDTLYYGSDYGNELCEKLYVSIADKKFICNIDEYITGIKNAKEKLEFIKMLGVAELPRKIKRKITIYNRDEKRRILKDLKYPYHLEKKEYFKSLEGALFDTTLYVDSTEVDDLSEILGSANTIDTLDWILSDNTIHRLLKEKREEHFGGVSITWGYKSTPRDILNDIRPYALICYRFDTAKWIQVGDKRYSINECVLTQNLNGILEPILAEPDIGFYIKDKSVNIKRSALESKYRNLLIELSVKTSFSDLPLSKIYEVFNALPQIDGSERIAKSLYTELIKDTDNEYNKKELEKLEEYCEFIKEGKVLCNTGYQLCAQARYLDGRDICEKIAKKFNLIELPQRMSRPNVEKLLGVKRLELKGTIVGKPEIHIINDKFQVDFNRFKPLAFCYRIDAKKALEGEARKFSNLLIIACSKIVANYNENETEIDDYEYILDGSGTYYLKVPDNVNERNFRQDYELAGAIGSIIASYMGIGELMAQCRSLYQQQTQKNREKQILDDIGDQTIIARAQRAMNHTDTVKDEFAEIMENISPVEEFRYSKCMERIDYENFSSIANASVIIDCFKKAKTDIANYNNQNPSVLIDLTGFYSQKVDSLLPLYKEKYMVSRYNELFESSLEEKEQLASLFAEYSSIAIDLENSAYFEPEKEIVRQLRIDVNCASVNFNELYNKNKKTWSSKITDNRFIDEFLDDTENQSLIYYACYDELNNRYEKLRKARSSDDEKPEEQPAKVRKLLFPAVQPKPIAPSGKHAATKTGFSQPSSKKRESIGRIGERIVYDFLSKDKTIKHLDWVSENAKKEQVNPEGRAGLGYDFDIVSAEGKRIFIEVKSSESSKEKGIVFYMSDFEYRFACEHQNEYVIYYVSEVTSKKPEISVLSDVIVDGEFNSEMFFVNSKSEYSISADISAESD